MHKVAVLKVIQWAEACAGFPSRALTWHFYHEKAFFLHSKFSAQCSPTERDLMQNEAEFFFCKNFLFYCIFSVFLDKITNVSKK
jgi:hypothetical protein